MQFQDKLQIAEAQANPADPPVFAYLLRLGLLGGAIGVGMVLWELASAIWGGIPLSPLQAAKSILMAFGAVNLLPFIGIIAVAGFYDVVSVSGPLKLAASLFFAALLYAVCWGMLLYSLFKCQSVRVRWMGYLLWASMIFGGLAAMYVLGPV